MAYSERPYAAGYSSYGLFPSGVKWLLTVNIAVFVLSVLLAGTAVGEVFSRLALIPAVAIGQFHIWQIFTYQFLHGGILHILGNMLGLYFFGQLVERAWGTQEFLKYYFLCAVGAGICVVVMAYLTGTQHTPTIGASGAVFGLLLAGAMLFPDQPFLFFLVYPLKLKHVAWIYGGIAFLGLVSARGGGVSDIAHLGGMLFGYVYIKTKRTRKSSRPVVSLMQWYKEWKLQRAKKKFQVYLRKHNSDRDRWVN
jgi:membrane associated rhomboid family serine protease